MESVRLKLGCGNYDRTRALMEGTVRPEGIDLSYVAMDPHHLFLKVLVDGEFDVSEISLSNLTTLISRGNSPLVGIPVFPSRMFRHSFVCVNAGAGISKPEDLIGRRVGVPEYTMTAAVWIRAFLQHDYGVMPRQLQWFQGGLNRTGRIDRIDVKLPDEISLQTIPETDTLSGALEAGQLDALVCASLPDAFRDGSPKVKRLFPNYKQVEAEYFRRTGIVPIMHTVGIRQAAYDRHPWVARSLFEAFRLAKKECYLWLEETGAPKVSLTWLQAYLEEERAIFGADQWPYGLEANRKSLEMLASCLYEQGLTQQLVPIENIFAKETWDLR